MHNQNAEIIFSKNGKREGPSKHVNENDELKKKRRSTFLKRRGVLKVTERLVFCFDTRWLSKSNLGLVTDRTETRRSLRFPETGRRTFSAAKSSLQEATSMIRIKTLSVGF